MSQPNWTERARGGGRLRLSRLHVSLLVALGVLTALTMTLLVLDQQFSTARSIPGATRAPQPSATAGSPSARAVVPTPLPSSPTAAPAASTATPLPAQPTPTEHDNRFAVLLLGYRGDGNGGGYLTDTLMVMIADPDNKTVAMLSLPRDVWTPLDFDGQHSVYNKLNTAYAFARDQRLYADRLPRYRGNQGAGTFAKDTVANLLGIPITAYATIDFDGFRRMIDAVGGIDVVVPSSFTAEYPRNDDPTIDPGWKLVHFQAGRQHMNGERALQFSRARLTVDNPAEGSDFARARRQRLVLTAFRDRVLQPSGLVRLPQLLSIVQKSSDTDYPLPSAPDLARLVAAWGEVRIYQTTLSLANYMQVGTGPSGEYILIPKNAGASWASVRAFARRLWVDPTLGQALADTPVAIVNRSGRADLGARAARILASNGYVVSGATTGATAARTTLRDRSGGRAQPLLAALKADLDLGDPTVVVEAAGQTPQVIVELGEDAAPRVAAVSPSEDPAAPTSARGVRLFGQWQPPVEVASEQVTPTPSSSPAATPAATAVRQPSPVPAVTSTRQATASARATTTTREATRPTPTPTRLAQTATKGQPRTRR